MKLFKQLWNKESNNSMSTYNKIIKGKGTPLKEIVDFIILHANDEKGLLGYKTQIIEVGKKILKDGNVGLYDRLSGVALLNTVILNVWDGVSDDQIGILQETWKEIGNYSYASGEPYLVDNDILNQFQF